MKTAFLFPGQGSQFAGMGSDLFEADPESRQYLDRADEALRFKLSNLILNGPEEELTRTAITQPAILTVSTAFAAYVARHGVRAEITAGHSLGEYSALVFAGALSFEDAVRAVHLRGKYMQEAVPEGEGAMAAIIGLSGEEVDAFCANITDTCVAAANFNAPGQTVISGSADGVNRVMNRAKEAGARKAIPLKVSAPFHCALMEPARVRMKAVLDRVDFGDLSIPLVTNIDARSIKTGGEARDALIRQIDGPVRWVQSVEHMDAQGVERYIEVAPGKVLTGLVKRIAGEADTVSLASLEDIQSFTGGTS